MTHVDPCGSRRLQAFAIILSVNMAPPTVGTYDFYFDIADKLEEIGAEFTLAIHPVGSEGVVVFSNVENPRVAREMVRSQDSMFRERFNADGDGI